VARSRLRRHRPHRLAKTDLALSQQLYAVVLAPTPDGKPWNLSQWSIPTALPSWTWPGHDGEPLQVEVYSRHPAVRLYLNGELLGEKKTTEAEAFKAAFTVPYAPGTLKAVGVVAGREVETFALETAGESLRLRLAADRSTLKSGRQDLVFVTIEAVDKAGRVHPLVDQSVQYSLTGPATIAAIGSGDVSSVEPYSSNPRRLYQGRSLVVLRATPETGEIVLTADAPALKPASVSIKSVPNL
jgi:beta-galactosidase